MRVRLDSQVPKADETAQGVKKLLVRADAGNQRVTVKAEFQV
jgi:hypothetical protein